MTLTPHSTERRARELIAVAALGTVVGVEVRSTAAAAQLRRLWGRCRAAEPVVQRLIAADSPLPLGPAQLQRLSHTLTDRGIAALAGRAVMLHAAGLAGDDGGVLALVAESGTGKTTAAARLCVADFGYVTDETVATLESGRVLPFPKPLSVVDDPQVPDWKLHRSPDELGLRRCPDELWLARVVLLRRHQEPCAPWLSEVDDVEAVTELVSHTSALDQLDRPVQRLLELIALTGPVLRLDYSEIEDAAGLLRQVTRSGAGAGRTAWRPVAAADGPVDGGGIGGGAGERFGEGRVGDGADFGETCLLLVDSAVVTLGPLGATLWREVRTRGLAGLEDLVEAAVDAYGDHPDAVELVRTAVDSMVAQGLLVRW